jgi:hypothetical protein
MEELLPLVSAGSVLYKGKQLRGFPLYQKINVYAQNLPRYTMKHLIFYYV